MIPAIAQSVTKEAAMEKLGVIGGMGAEATSYYYDQVVRHTAAACDQGTYRHGGALQVDHARPHVGH